MKNARYRYLLAGGAALALASAANAQSAGSEPSVQTGDATTVADVIVTAAKRDQRLIDVPASVTALQSAQLISLGAQRVEDYAAYVPGLAIVASGPGFTQFSIRGVTTGNGQASATVSTYFDEAPTNSSSAFALGSKLTPDPDLLDVERIEVLRGPQGTLYGANALGGVVRYVLARPPLTGHAGKAEAGVTNVSHGETGWVGRAALSAALVEGRLGARLSGFYVRDPGFIDNAGTGRSDVNRSDNWGFRGALRAQVNDAVSIDLSSLYQRRVNDGNGAETVDRTTLAPTGGEYQQNYLTDEGLRTNYQLHALTVNADLGFATLTSATSYGIQDSLIKRDTSYGLAAALGVYAVASEADNEVEKLTQEVRLTSPVGGFVEYSVGAFYTKEDAIYSQIATAFLPGGIPLPAPVNPLIEAAIYSRYAEYALFANGTLNLSDRLSVQVGGRYSHNKQDFRETFGGLLFGALAGTEITGESGEGAWTYAVAPQFKLSETSNVYARVAKGFRPGGTNLLPPGAAGLVAPTYRADSLINYEVGTKSLWLDRRLSTDLAVYRIEWSDIQTSASLGTFAYFINGGRARSTGVEASAQWNADGLQVGANLAYNDSALRDPIVSTGGQTDDPLPYSPKWSGALTLRKEIPLTGGWSASFGGGVRYNGARQAYYSLATSSNPANLRLPSYTVLDLNAGLRRGPLDLNVYIQNLTDEHAILSVQTEGASPFTALGSAAFLARPRTIGVMARLDF